MKYIRLIIFIILAGQSFIVRSSESPGITLSGYVKDAENGEALIGAGVFVNELKKGTATNVYGYYSITVPKGTYKIIFTYVGYATTIKTITMDGNIRLDIELGVTTQQLEEVVVTADRPEDNIYKAEMSTVKLDMKTIKSIPALVGEIDPIKVIQMLPGVQVASEGTTGFNVRGGASDQNLVLLDEATVYNPSHAMGFLSVFNNDAIKDVKLYKADIPAQYGGRLSSMLDVRMRDGNNKKFTGSGGIGIVSSRLTLEGPIVKDQGSILLSGRLAYMGLFLPFAKQEQVRESDIYFYDVNLKANYSLGKSDKLFVSGYIGRDKIAVSDFGFEWGNRTATVRWNHLFSDRVFCNTSVIFSDYDYSLGGEMNGTGFKMNSGMQDFSLKHDYAFYINPNNTLRFGVQSILHKYQPGKIDITGSQAEYVEEDDFKIPNSQALENALYVSNEQKITSRLTFDYGLRYSMFHNMGPTVSYQFDEKYQRTGADTFAKNKIYNTFAGWEGLEPRAGITFILDSSSSIKANYTRTRQYVQLASNAVIGMPTDLWVPSSPNIKPQYADQYGIGYFRNFFNNNLETSIEVFYKNLYNQIDFRDYAQLMLNPAIEGEFRFGKGKAYGMELLVRKQVGDFQGWVGYTYSRVFRYFADINDGKAYSAPYDKPHNISVVLMYTLNPRISFSTNWVYSTGSAFTLPAGKYQYNNMVIGVITQRNGSRMPDYHRLDIGMTWKPEGKPDRRFKNEWNFGIYNLYYRKNPWMISVGPSADNPNEIESTMTYLFAVIPSITWNFRF